MDCRREEPQILPAHEVPVTHRVLIALPVVLLLMSAVASAQQFGPWSPPVNLGSTVNATSDDMHPTLSKDGLSLIISSTRPGGSGGLDLWVSQRDSLDSPGRLPRTSPGSTRRSTTIRPVSRPMVIACSSIAPVPTAATLAGVRNCGRPIARTRVTISAGNRRSISAAP